MSHSAIVGGSNADRLLNCPGSFQLNLKLPPAAERIESEYAAEGTAMHAVKADLMHARQINNDLDLYALAEAYKGRMFHDRVLTQEHLDTMIYPALQHLEDLEAEYHGGFTVAAVEKSVKFPGVPGAFGTCDLILQSPTHVLHVDWKFGSGVSVQAVYPDPAGDIVNAQLLFYITAAIATARQLYQNKRKLVAAIIQPRCEPGLTHTLVNRKEIKWFAQDLQNAVVKAQQYDPPLRKGEWCRWCPAKTICPKWTQPMLELASLGSEVKPRTEMVIDQVSDYGLYLSRAKTLVDMAGQFKKTLDEQLHAYLEDGGVVPGWRLKAKEKQRQWVDAAFVEPALMALGFGEDDIWRHQLQTFAATDATAKRLGVRIPDDLRVKPETSETTVCQTDDPAPMVNRPLAIEAFRKALKAITQEKTA